MKLRIADIVISVISEDKKQKFGVDEPYRHFITDGKPDISLHTHYGYIPKSKLGEKVFDTGTTWSLYQNNGKYILKTSSMAIILEPDFKLGRIYIKRNESRTIFPLGYPLDEVLMINLLAKGEGMIVHACGISDNGQGILFAGISQSGKSSMAILWKKKARSALRDKIILSDDRIIIRKMRGQFWIYGTPWHGDAKVCSPEKAPLERIFFLNQARENKTEGIEGINATAKLLVCSFPTFWDKNGMEFTLGFIEELTREVPCYDLGFLPDERVIDFIKNI